jgi:hypothetical protein
LIFSFLTGAKRFPLSPFGLRRAGMFEEKIGFKCQVSGVREKEVIVGSAAAWRGVAHAKTGADHMLL